MSSICRSSIGFWPEFDNPTDFVLGDGEERDNPRVFNRIRESHVADNRITAIKDLLN